MIPIIGIAVRATRAAIYFSKRRGRCEKEEVAVSEMSLEESLGEIRGVEVSAEAVRAHVMRPAHLDGVFSDRGPEGLLESEGLAVREGVSYGFDGGAFARALQAELKDSVAGYVMSIAWNGPPAVLVEWNWAKEPQDGGEGWSPDVRMHVASCSKVVTAIAMIKLLYAKRIAFNQPIIGYLPGYWAKGPNIEKITFAELFTHTSGLDFNVGSSASDFMFMKSQIAAGTTHVGEYWYQNMNFGLCRILLATINGNVRVDYVAPTNNDEAWDRITTAAYEAYVAANVFAPAGVTNATLVHEPQDALAYNFPVSGNGWNSGDLTTMAGGAGWHLSTNELLKVMGTFRRANTIVTPAQAQAALDASFGIDIIGSTRLGSSTARTAYGATALRWSNASPSSCRRTWSSSSSSTRRSVPRRSSCSASSASSTKITSYPPE